MNFLKKYVVLLLIILPSSYTSIIKGVSVFGFETEYKDIMCTWENDHKFYIDKIIELGFNYIRLPFSLQYIQESNWDKMDNFLYLCNQSGINIVLDFHRLNSHHQSFRPWDDVYSFDSFKQGWLDILNRYEHYDNVKGVDIFNEYQGEDFTEWNWIATEIVQFIEYHFPLRFDYIIQGIRWSGSTDNVIVNIDYIDDSRIQYSLHKYSFSNEWPRTQAWDYDFDWDHKKNINIGEVGFISSVVSDVDFFKELVEYLIMYDVSDTFFWTMSPNSGDTGGILLENCRDVDWIKMNLLYSYWNSFDNKKKRNLKQVSAPGSPESVSGISFVLNTNLKFIIV